MKKIGIIGGGVAGLSAAVYALRANAEVTVFEQFGLGGLTANINKIENFPSYKNIEGWQFADNLVQQVKALGVKVVRSKVLSLTKEENFVVKTEKGDFDFPSVIVATGTAHNKLGFEAPFVGRGVSYCATCDGNFYKDMPVAVAGFSTPAVREALYLADLCSKVYMIVPQEDFSEAEDLAVQTLLAKPNVQVLYNTQVTQVMGEQQLSAIQLYDGKSYKLEVSALFVAMGAQPVTGFIHVNGLKKKKGFLVVDGKCQTSVEGLFAAGDVTDGLLKQIVTACGDGAKAGAFASIFAGRK